MSIDQKERLKIIANKIDFISDEIDNISDTFFEAGVIQATIILCSRVCEKIIRTIYSELGLKPASSIFMNNIEELSERKVLPPEISSCMHIIRIYGNKCRHGSECIRLIEEDAFLIIETLIRILMWYLTEFERGPRFQSIYHNQESNDSKKILIWNDISPAIAKKFMRHIFREEQTHYDVVFLDRCQDLLGYNLDSNVVALILLVTDVTKLSESEKIRKYLNEKIEEYVAEGGTVIGSHDLIYRRARNKLLEKLFGCTVNEFKRLDKPLTYKKAFDCSLFAPFQELPDEFVLDDGELCWGNWAPDCNILFETEDQIPLVVLREYGEGVTIWLNSGDYKEFPPTSIAKPEKPFVDLLKASFRYIIERG